MINPDIKETVDELEKEQESEKPELPEAPVSITVRGYYKGFSVLITKRNADGKVELKKIIGAIDNMVEKGFKPSWNEETNGKNTAKEEDKHICAVHNVEMKERVGKNGTVFYSHAKKMDDEWIYCSGKGWGK